MDTAFLDAVIPSLDKLESLVVDLEKAQQQYLLEMAQEQSVYSSVEAHIINVAITSSKVPHYQQKLAHIKLQINRFYFNPHLKLLLTLSKLILRSIRIRPRRIQTKSERLKTRVTAMTQQLTAEQRLQLAHSIAHAKQ